MTIADSLPTPAAPQVWQPRTEIDLAAQQLRAIDRFNDARRVAAEAAAAAARSRELRMDASRRLDVVRRVHEALVARAHEQLQITGALLRGRAQRRVVLAHRSEWFVGKVADLLRDAGIVVVAQLENGADTVGVVIAEQPDLLLVEDTLAMVPGEQVVREVRQYAPDTFVTAQVGHGDRVGRFLEAGAASVFTRTVSPAHVAQAMQELVTA